MEKALLRRVEREDYENINVLMNEVHNLHVLNRSDIYRNTDVVLPQDDFENIINDRNKIAILATIDSEVVGVCFVTIKEIRHHDTLVSRRIAYMDDLCVHSHYRRRGIGDMLFEEIKKRASKNNADSLELMVWEFNKGAYDFYRHKNMKTRSRILEMKL